MTTPFSVYCVRYSGIRLRSAFSQNNLEVENLARGIVNLVPGLADLLQKAPQVVDDNFRGLSEILFWCKGILDGELILCHAHKDGPVVGVVFVRDIHFGASCEINCFVRTEHLNACMSDVLDYLWKPLPEGLGCSKVKLRCREDNTQAAQIVQDFGFTPRAILTGEACFHGVVVSMVLAELLNPTIFSTAEEISSGGIALHESSEPEQPRSDGTNDVGAEYEQPDIEQLLRQASLGGAELRPTGQRDTDASPDVPDTGGQRAASDDSPRVDTASDVGKRSTPIVSTVRRRTKSIVAGHA